MSVRYDFCDNLIFGEKASKHKKKIINNINKNKFSPDIFLVTLPVSKTSGMLEIYRCMEFRQNAYDGLILSVVGVAKGKDEAIDIVTSIIRDTHETQNDLDVRRFLGMNEEGTL